MLHHILHKRLCCPYVIQKLYIIAIMPKLQALTHNGFLLCQLFIVLVGECIQGLVLLGNQWLLFVELGGLVNNTFFMSQSARLSTNVPLEFLFVWFFFFWFFFVMFMDWSEHNPLCVPCPGGPVLYHTCVHEHFEYTV